MARRRRGWKRRSRRPRHGLGPIGWGLLAISLLWFWGLVWSLDPAATIQASLRPHPEAAESLDAAVGLIENGRLGVHRTGHPNSSSDTTVFSVVTAAAIAAGVAPYQAPFLLNKVAGAAMLVSVFLIASRAGGLPAGLAAMLLVTRCSFVALSRSPLADALAALALMWAGVWLFDYARRRRRWKGAAAVVLLTVAAAFRPAVTPLVALAPLAWWLRADLLNRERRRDLSIGIALLVAGLVPPLLLATLSGSPPRLLTDLSALRLSHAADNLIALWGDLTQSGAQPIAAQYAEGSLLSPAYLVLTVLALEVLLTSRVWRWFVGLAAAYALTTLYAPSAPRLLFPLIVLSVAPVAAATLQRLTTLWAEQRRVPLAAHLLLLAIVLIGWPGSRASTDLSDLFRLESLTGRPLDYEAIQLVQAWAGDAQWLLLTDLEPAYAHAISRGDRLIVPLSAADSPDLLAGAIADGRLIFAAVTEPDTVSLPRIPGLRWRIRWRHPRALVAGLESE